jgi:galactose mutarotase-like enzyme
MEMKTIALSGSGMAAEISELGAELVRLTDKDGRDLLWNGDPGIWAGRAPLLFPMVGRAKDDRIRIEGRHYELPKHGFARTSRFALIEHTGSRCVFRLSSGVDTLAHYPFSFQLDVIYDFDGPVLNNYAVVTNTDERALPVSFGFHPAFLWPLPYGAPREAHEIVFEREEGPSIRRVRDGLLTPTRHPSPLVGKRLALTDALFVEDALIFVPIASGSVTYGAPGTPSLRIGFSGMPHLGIWTKPGAGFICIEPWQGFASPEDFDGEFSGRPGVMTVPAEGEARFAMQVSLVPNDRTSKDHAA